MNKPKIIPLLLLLLAFTYAKGQDKIITSQNDTILCRIVSILPTHIQYEQINSDRSAVGRFIPIEQVKEYYYRSAEYKTPFGAFQSKQPAEPFPRWRIGIRGGGAHLLSSFSGLEKDMQSLGISQSKINDYLKQLRNGICFGTDVHYLITNFFGVGLNYSLFTTSTQLDYTIATSGFYTVPSGYFGYYIPAYFPLSEKGKIYVNYVGPSVVFQHRLDKNCRFRMNEEVSIGYARYREEDRLDPYQYLILNQSIVYLSNVLTEGNALGGSIRLSFEYYPRPWLSVGANAGGFLATFTTVKTSTKETSDTQKLDKSLNMSLIDYSLAIRFHF